MNSGDSAGLRLKPADLGLGQLFSVVGDSVIVGDVSTGHIVLWNPAAERMFGYSADQAVGMPIEQLVAESLRHQHRAGFSRFAATGRTRLVGTGQAAELPARRRDGSEFWIDLTLSPIEAPAGPGRFVLAIVRDVTERRQIQAQLVATAEQLQTANQSLREFLAMAAHDLRGPLTAIVAAAGLLASSERNDRGVIRLSQLIMRQGDALNVIIADVADVGDIELGEVAVRPVLIDVGEVVTEAAEGSGLDPAAVTAAIPGRTKVWADRNHVRRIVANYLTNASKYGRAGVSVAVRTVRQGVRIGVTDEGPGVPAEFVGRLFDKFTRADSTRRQPGRGLGLAIAAGLARANRGKVWYEPNQPTGAQFWVALPAEPGTSCADEPT